ncbi:MAG TPA: hypothetical protein VGK27_06890 [Candidatus Deferrimicrobiaceae bacterium]
MKQVAPIAAKASQPTCMSASTSFFLPGIKDCDCGYLNIQRSEFLRPVKINIERLWEIYQPYADRHFREDACKHFLQRYWEMYLAVALIDSGFTLFKPSDEGPEFFIEIDGRRVWVEAIAPEGGEGPDRVSEFPPGAAFNVPTEKILLRYTHALAEKHAKYQRDLEKGIIGIDDGYILAINCRMIPHASFGGVIPYPIQAYLPFGHPAVSFDVRTGKIVDRYFEKREAISKLAGAQIPTTAFLNPAYAGISAIIHSAVDAANSPVIHGEDFVVLHNPLAAQPIREGAFSRWRQYKYEDGRLTLSEAVLPGNHST